MKIQMNLKSQIMVFERVTTMFTKGKYSSPHVTDGYVSCFKQRQIKSGEREKTAYLTLFHMGSFG